jgi:uncharacterized glyoxalase superfamily protein PhnB
MSGEKSYIRQGLGAVRPYLYSNLELPAFLTSVFGAEIVESTLNRSGGSHVEMRLTDSVFVIETGETLADRPRSSVYVYVEDVDATYRLALENGATPIAEPEIKPYDERAGGFKDAYGNTWWIGTYLGTK